METRILEVKTIMDRWARLRNVLIHVRAVNWIHLSRERDTQIVEDV